ncbi:hypothetical protein ACHAWX_000039, partial [Stephanocyclus meneghinianus]
MEWPKMRSVPSLTWRMLISFMPCYDGLNHPSLTCGPLPCHMLFGCTIVSRLMVTVFLPWNCGLRSSPFTPTLLVP